MSAPTAHLLTCHPDAPSYAVRTAHARVARSAGGTLIVTYALQGNMARLRVPEPQPPRFASGLWRHTCCELFIGRAGEPRYHELNLAPSGEWAAYAFAAYRDGTPLAERTVLNPQIRVRQSAEALELDATIRLDLLALDYVGSELRLGISAVVEDVAGALSYWALAHPPGKPDFHHRDGFALTLDEVRH